MSNRAEMMFADLVRRLEPGAVAPRGMSKKVYDTSNERLLDKRPQLSGMLQRARFVDYALDAGARVHINEERYEIDTPVLGGIPVDVAFHSIALADGGAEKLVRNLHGGDSLWANFQEYVRRSLRAFLQDPRGQELLSGAANEAVEDAAKRHLAEDLRRDLGVTVNVVIELPRIEGVRHMPEESVHFHPKDYDEALEAKYSVSVEGTPVSHRSGGGGRVISPRELAFLMRSRAEALLAGLTIHAIRTDADAVADVLRPDFKRLAAEHGLKLVTLRARVDISVDVEVPSTLEHTVSCSVLPAGTKVQIRHDLQVELADLGKLVKRKVKQPKAWLERTLENETGKVLHDCKLLDLIENFDDEERQIREAVKAEAESVGLEVRHHVSSPNHPIRSLVRDGFSIPRDRAKNLFSGMHTADGDVDFGLRVHITGRLAKLDYFQDLIESGHDSEKEQLRKIEERLESRAYSAITQVVQDCFPDELYLHFDLGRPLSSGDEDEEEDARRAPEAVARQEAPRARIVKALQQAFPEEKIGAILQTISLSPEKSELIDRFKDLAAAGTRRIEIDVEPLSNYVEKVPFEIVYQVDDIEPRYWPRFQNFLGRKREGGGIEGYFEDLDDAILSLAKRNLAALSPEDLRYTDLGVARQIQAFGFKEAQDHVRRAFGLRLHFVSVSRGRSTLEMREADRQVRVYDALGSDHAAKVEQITGDLSSMREKLAEHVNRGKDDEAEKMRERIAAKEAELKEQPGVGNEGDVILQPRPSTTRIANLLPESSSQKLITQEQERRSKEAQIEGGEPS